jgi:hypothetical protein
MGWYELEQRVIGRPVDIRTVSVREIICCKADEM